MDAFSDIIARKHTCASLVNAFMPLKYEWNILCYNNSHRILRIEQNLSMTAFFGISQRCSILNEIHASENMYVKKAILMYGHFKVSLC